MKTLKVVLSISYMALPRLPLQHRTQKISDCQMFHELLAAPTAPAAPPAGATGTAAGCRRVP